MGWDDVGSSVKGVILNICFDLKVAQQGLSMSDLGTDERLQRHSTGLGSYPEIHVPVYAAVKGVSKKSVEEFVCRVKSYEHSCIAYS